MTAGVHSSCVTKQNEADSFKRSRSDGAYRVATFGCRELLPCGRTADRGTKKYRELHGVNAVKNAIAVPRYYRGAVKR